MAVSKGQASTEGAVRRLYAGVGSCFVKAVNPTKAELEKIYGRDFEKDPEYLTSVETDDHKQIPQVKIDVIVKPDPEKYLDMQNQPIDTLIHVTLFLRRQYRYGSKTGKYQIIDKYGRTAWATKEDIEAKRIPMYKDKDGNDFQANISPDYIPAYEGLEELTNLIRAYLNIPTVEKWENNKIVGLIDNPADAEVLPDHIEDLFKGNFSEIREIFGYQPDNKVKICFGVRTTEENKQYQAAYTRMFLKNNIIDYKKLEKHVADAKNGGAFPTTEFDFSELHEYMIAPTSFAAPAQSAMPNTEGVFGATPWGGGSPV